MVLILRLYAYCIFLDNISRCLFHNYKIFLEGVFSWNRILFLAKFIKNDETNLMLHPICELLVIILFLLVKFLKFLFFIYSNHSSNWLEKWMCWSFICIKKGMTTKDLLIKFFFSKWAICCSLSLIAELDKHTILPMPLFSIKKTFYIKFSTESTKTNFHSSEHLSP